jgi:hypothetical protein
MAPPTDTAAQLATIEDRIAELTGEKDRLEAACVEYDRAIQQRRAWSSDDAARALAFGGDGGAVATEIRKPDVQRLALVRRALEVAHQERQRIRSIVLRERTLAMADDHEAHVVAFVHAAVQLAEAADALHRFRDTLPQMGALATEHTAPYALPRGQAMDETRTGAVLDGFARHYAGAADALRRAKLHERFPAAAKSWAR